MKMPSRTTINPNRVDPGYKDPGTCDIGRNFDPQLCQLRHYKAIRSPGYEPCAYCPLIIAFIKKEKGEYEVKKKYVRKKDRSGICIHCKKNVNSIVARGLCPKCYHTPTIKEKYPAKKPNNTKEDRYQSGIELEKASSGQNHKILAKPLELNPLEKLLEAKQKMLSEHQQQFEEQKQLLKMKSFEINALESLVVELERVLEEIKK